jgi:O-antigen biosynthesis protein
VTSDLFLSPAPLDLRPPHLSILTVDDDPAGLRRTYASLAAQTDRAWQWCLAGGVDARVAAGLPLDPRIVNSAGTSGHWADRLVDAFRSATGRHVMHLRAGDELSTDAVAALAGAVPAEGWAYSDEEVQVDEEQPVDADRTAAVWLKPDFSPEWLRSQPYPVRAAVLPRERLADLGGVRPAAGTAAWYDAVLRISEVVGEPRHLRRPHLVRTHRDASRRFVDGDPEEYADVVRKHCERVGIRVIDVTPTTVGGCVVGQRVRRSRDPQPAVSIVVPTRGGTSVIRGRARCHVVELVRSLWVEGRYPDLEIVIVYDDDTPAGVLDELRALVGDEHLVLSRYDEWFHFARKCNAGAVAARGEYLCFLNDDMEVITTDWLDEMVTQLQDPGVGAVGARLLFEDGSLQHIGHQYTGGAAGHPLFGQPGDTLHMGAVAHVAGERSGVTAACVLVRREEFMRLGGFSDVFPVNYNDVDFCLKVREAGMRIVYTPHAEIFHFESQSRVPRILASEHTLLHRRWPMRMRRDPYIPYLPTAVPVLAVATAPVHVGEVMGSRTSPVPATAVEETHD